MSNVTISVREYDIEALSNNLPGSYSHIGLHWSDGRAYNFGSFKNGKYQPVGSPFDFNDRLGGLADDLGMPYPVAAEVEVSKDMANAYYDAVDMFSHDLYNKNIGYVPLPEANAGQANSNTAAKFMAEILGINPSKIAFSGSMFGFEKDLTRYGLAPPKKYLEAAYARYLDSLPSGTIPVPTPRPTDRCFAAGTLIRMANGLEKPIELIRPGDVVASFDETADGGRCALVGKRVLRTFVNENQIVIDFHGTKVTPGHAYLCGDGQHEGRFRQIMTIIRDDGAVVMADGTLMRAATGCPVGSPGDAFVEVQIAHPGRHMETGEAVTLLKERGRIRAGTRVQRPDGSSFSFLKLIENNGWTLHEDGLVSSEPDQAGEPLFFAGRAIPKPEDYILALSQLTLADLYDDPRQAEMPHSIGGMHQGEANAVVLQAAASPEDRAEGEGFGAALGRRVRAIGQAGKAKRGRAPKHAGETVH